jgi:hypothetical protein
MELGGRERGDEETGKPAVGTDAAANSQDFGTSRWQLSAHATSFDCRTEEALRSGIGTFETCRLARKLSAYWGEDRK